MSDNSSKGKNVLRLILFYECLKKWVHLAEKSLLPGAKITTIFRRS